MSQTAGDPFVTPPFSIDYGAGKMATAVESLQGTVVTTVGPIIYNSALSAFALTSGKQISVNGVVDPVTSSVILLFYWNHAVWQENASKNFYHKVLAGDSWIGPTTTDPRIAPPTITHAILQTRIDAVVVLLNGIRADLASLSP
jgi:hypothetical protein